MGRTGPVGGATAKRVLGGVLLGGAAIVVLSFFGGTAYGLTVTDQDATVDNAGVGVANSGGNVAVGNVSGDQTAVNAQGAATLGGVAANQGSATNESKGSATIVTGSATATGNQSSTGVGQSANSVGGGGGLGVTAQDADVNNVGVGVANSGLNAAVGNIGGDQVAVNGQLALAGFGVAANTGGASNVSEGSATIITGPATGIGNQSLTGIGQSANALGGGGITIQDADVNNFGVGIGNSGGNLAVGNIAGDQTAVNLQGAFTLFGVAVNAGGASNVSTGNALIVTGPATGIGNQSQTGISQSATTLGGWWWFPGVTLQDVTVNNFGVGLANSGFNAAVGNIGGDQLAVNIGVALALGGFSANTGGASNVSSGNAAIFTGAATGIGNSSSTTVSQASTSSDPFFWGPWWWWFWI